METCYIHSTYFNRNNTLYSFIRNYIRRAFMGFHPCKAACNIIYKYKYITHLVNVGIKLLSTETKDSNNAHRGDLAEHSGLLFRKVAHLCYDAPSSLGAYKLKAFLM
jgi:hypothetical protein